MRKLLIAMASLAALTAQAEASRKPCRDATGKIIACPKPSSPPQQRCKDAQGRFIPCAPAPPPKQ